MTSHHSTAETHGSDMQFIGDDIALNFINTSYGVDEGARECFQSDADVLTWLDRSELPAKTSGIKPGDLLRQALELREIALELVQARRAGKAGNPRRLNRLLEAGSRYSELLWPRSGVPEVTSRERLQGAGGLLLPVAQAVADLLSGPRFEYVRRCEGPACTLWFVERTKAHSRRWCSPAQCGNRAKVAAFRDRSRNA